MNSRHHDAAEQNYDAVSLRHQVIGFVGENFPWQVYGLIEQRPPANCVKRHPLATIRMWLITEPLGRLFSSIGTADSLKESYVTSYLC
jgi:hypothetical protein